MSRKEMVSAKIGGKTFDRLENYSNEEGISRSQAIDRMLKQGLDVEESDIQNYLNLILSVTVLWFAIYFTIELSTVLTAVTGLPLVAILGYLVYKEWS